MLADFYVGVDLGKSQDHTAGVGSPTRESAGGWVSPTALSPTLAQQARGLGLKYGRPAKPPLSVRHVERLPLGTLYPAITERIARLLAIPPLADRQVDL